MQQSCYRNLSLIITCLALFFSHGLFATTPFSAKPEVREFIHTMVVKHGFNQQKLTEIMNQAVYQPRIIESMNKPYEKKTWDVYKNLFLTQDRLQKGLEFWETNHAALAQAEKKYQVPASIIVAIIGVETTYGKNQGSYRVLDALSTLAFYYPSRAPFFKKELGEFLLLCREHQVSPTEYLGSYAGAMGKPQFMPSSYRFYADDFAGQVKKDLMHDDEAVIASVANYIHRHGWVFEQAVAKEALITGSRYKRINTYFKTASYSPLELARAGVKPVTPPLRTPQKAGLIELVKSESSEYWLTYPNFYVITRYNTSPQYAMAVYLLAQGLQHQWVLASHGRKTTLG